MNLNLEYLFKGIEKLNECNKVETANFNVNLLSNNMVVEYDENKVNNNQIMFLFTYTIGNSNNS